MKSQENIEERFLNDIKNHSLEVLMDNGVYRHLKFSNNGSSCYRFDLITFPGHLLITGDMGDILFERVTDMFTFFRHEKINPEYWAEKIEAKDSEIVEFNFDSFKKHVDEYVNEFIENEVVSDEDAESLRGDIEFIILHRAKETVRELNEAYQLLNDYTYIDRCILDFNFRDSFEWKFEQYTFHYLWKLHAIVWGIKKYDELCGE